MKVTLLGTGTPNPSLERQSSGHLFEVGNDVIIMDLGPGAFQRYLESGRDPTDMTHVFFSHLHYDHCLDYPRAVLQRWDMGAGKIPELKVYGPRPLAEMTDRLFGEEKGAFSPDLLARTSHRASLDAFEARGGTLPRAPLRPDVTEVHPGDVIKGDSWKVTVGEAIHFQPYLECFGYRLDCDDGTSVCYSGDTGKADSIAELARGCDLLIHMLIGRTGREPSAAYRNATAGHLDAAEVASRAGVRTLALVHMLEQIDRPGIREQLICEMREVYKGNIIWGADLMEVPLSLAFDNSVA
jgi:ribonuclease BN (tRNA processing enzyme)